MYKKFLIWCKNAAFGENKSINILEFEEKRVPLQLRYAVSAAGA